MGTLSHYYIEVHLSQHYLLKSTSFPLDLKCYFNSIQKLHMQWNLLKFEFSIIGLAFKVLVSHFLKYRGFIIYFNIWWASSPFLLFFKAFFFILFCLCFQINSIFNLYGSKINLMIFLVRLY